MLGRVTVGMLAFLVAVGTATAAEPNYPSKVIRIVTAMPGSANDVGARFIAQGLTNTLGQRAIVDNRVGYLGIETVARAAPDGYTFLFFGNGVIWYSQFFNTEVSWDPEKDFLPVTLAIRSPNVLAVHPSLPVKSVRDLIALAKARPGELNYASGQGGGESHLAMELFKAMTKTDIARISYKGTGQSISALMSGEVQLILANAGSVMPHANSGRLHALAVASTEPSVLTPGLPTLSASVPGYESGVIIGLWAPARTPAGIVSLINREAVRALNRPETKKIFFDSGIEVVGSSPEEFAAILKSEFAKWSKVIKALDTAGRKDTASRTGR